MPKKSGPIKVKSFWGAIASFPVLQVFGYIVFQGFAYSFSFRDLFSLIFLIVYLLEQIMLFSQINEYILGKKQRPYQLKPKDIIKIVIGFLFLLLWIAFILGYYPFAKTKTNILHNILFYLISWSISAWLSIIKRIPNVILTQSLTYNIKRGYLILILIPFVYGALSAPIEMVYTFLMIPLFLIYILLVSWMVEA